VYERRFEFLVDLNMELLGVMLAALRLPAEFTVSESYVAATPADLDLRGKKALRRTSAAAPHHHVPVVNAPGCVSPGAPFALESTEYTFPEYTQVFHDRMPFEPDLSALDLLLCEGPSARDYL